MNKSKISNIDSGDVTLLELIVVMIMGWRVILTTTVISTSCAVIYAMNKPDMYKAETLLIPVIEETPSIPRSLSQFGGIATMAGVSIPRDPNKDQLISTLTSRKFLRKFIEKKNLMPALFDDLWNKKEKKWHVEDKSLEPTIQMAVSLFRAIMTVTEDRKSGLIVLSIIWAEADLAADWANDLVRQLNEQLREKAIQGSQKKIGYLEKELSMTKLNQMMAVLYSLLEAEKQKAMLANVNEDFALEIIDPAVVPNLPAKPNRKLIVLFGCFFGGVSGAFFVFLLQFIKKLFDSQAKLIS